MSVLDKISDFSYRYELAESDNMYPDLKTISERLKWARKNKGLTQMELASKAGVSRNKIVDVEIGRTTRPRDIDKIATVLEVDPGWLLFGTKAAQWSEFAVRVADEIDGLPEHLQQTIRTILDSNK